ncbi:glycosyltransferase family 4 protein [Flavobacteriaceae bacterium]|nr:glycosyltransferase family 4 protein [Flavobacteriaceae bacterium]
MEKDLKIIKKYYKDALNKAKISLNLNEVDQSLNYLKLASTIGWLCPFKYNFGDNEIEEILKKISLNIRFQEYEATEKIILYCTSIRDFGALVQQYLYNLPDVTLIVHDKIIQSENRDILKFVNDKQIKYHYLGDAESFSEKIKYMNNIVQELKPKKVFLHFDPNDVFGATYFIKLKHIAYFINASDHLFWIGKNCFSTIIDFRKYGYWFTRSIRKINNVNHIVLPFYPILPKENFRDEKIIPKNKIIGISGGNLYKYNQDPDLLFFKIIIKLLKKNPNFYFILCGSGDSTLIRKLIKKNNIDERFKIYGFRRDFSEIIKRSDIYFNSYPMAGGLAPLYALNHKVPVVSIAFDVRNGDSLEEFFEIDNFKSLENIYELESFTDKLINDEAYRIKIINKQKLKNLNNIYFKETLKNIVEDKVTFKLNLEKNNFNFNYDLNLKTTLSEKNAFNNIIYWNFIYNINNVNFFIKFSEYLKTIKSLKNPRIILVLKIHITLLGLKNLFTSFRAINKV